MRTLSKRPPGKTRFERNEKGAIRKRWHGRTSVALVYPNVYAVGTANLGFQSVYAALNAYDHIVAERFFLPADKITGKRGKAAHPAWLSEESHRPLSDFDLIVFSVSFETDYIHVIEAIKSAGVSLHSEDRDDEEPLILAGGVATAINPEPLAPSIDAFLLGDFEEMAEPFSEILPDLADAARARSGRLITLRSAVPGVYVPATVRPVTDAGGIITGWDVAPGITFPVPPARLRTPPVTAPCSIITSYESAFKDMFLVELSRGCGRGCRFCAAGYVYRPPRPWPFSSLTSALERIGEEKRVGLIGLEFLGREDIEAMSRELLESGRELAFSSLRADAVTPYFVSLLKSSRTKVATIAPEAGSERMRRIINKNLSEADILRAAQLIVDGGIPNLKLYFMIGFPFETDGDVREIVRLVSRIRESVLPIGRARGHVGTITVSVNTFVPKAWTPFQWAGFASDAILSNRRELLRKGLQALPNVRLSLDSFRNAKKQAILSRGDRRLNKVIGDVAEGIPWSRAMKNRGLSDEEYLRERREDEILPWDVVGHPVRRSYLIAEWKKAEKERRTRFCDTTTCRRCGACTLSAGSRVPIS